MKKFVIAVAVLVGALSLWAGPHRCGPCGPGPRRPCPPPPSHHHHGGDWWGPGGRNFWPGFVGGLVGGAIAAEVSRPAVVVSQPAVVTAPVAAVPVAAAPVVVQQPVVVQAPVTQVQNVWVEGRYVDTVRANGTVVRTWQPGHYEQHVGTWR